jgi:hypothetical protein
MQNRGKGSGSERAARTGYILAAIAIWALAFYSLSGASRRPPDRVAERTLRLCNR